MEEKNEYAETSGAMASILVKIGVVLAVVMSVFQLYTAAFGCFEGLLQRSLHFGFAAAIVLILYPLKGKKWQIVNYLFVAVTLLSFWWIYADYERISTRWPLADEVLRLDYIFGTLATLLILEATRRCMGWSLPLIAAIFLVYAFVGPYLPGLLHHRGYSYTMVLDELYLTTEGIFGVAASASATFVFLFVLFGAFLDKTKVGEFFLSLTYSITGSMKGGPAKTAVVASGLMGMVSGSGIGNVATTGVFTIPLMKRMGYMPHIAGAIEAAASSGGQIMPPIMGAAAFIMAEFTGVPYIEIIKIALIPALLYYMMLIFQVHFRAHRRNIPVIPRSELPSVFGILKKGWYLSLPLFILVILLVLQYTPLFAGVYAIVAITIVSMFRSDTRLNLKRLLVTLEAGAKSAAPIAMACACAGIVVGVITLTGLGMKFSSMIVSFAGGSMFFGIVLVAATSMFLGMGLPVVAAYVVLAVLAAPALAELGATIIAAHLAVMWFTQTSNITPPVCLAAFTAAAIAKAEPMKTGWSAIRYGLGFYFIPFLFFYSPILLNGKVFDIVLTIVTAMIGIVAVSASFEAFLVRRLNVAERVILGISGVLLVWPDHAVSLLGLCLSLASVAWQMKTRKKYADETESGSM